MAWRVARSLDKLLAQLNAMYPHRSKISDGSIGDAAHASRSSDHNPWYGPGIVTARDFTHDPSGGIDCNQLAHWLVTSGDPRIKYVIWNRRIWQNGWQPYYGSNPHDHHLHLSVEANASCDDTRAWKLGAAPVKAPTLKVGTRSAAVKRMKQLLWARLTPARLKALRQKHGDMIIDNHYSRKTAEYVREFGRQVGINNGGEYGNRTRGWLDPPKLVRGSSGNAVRWVQIVLNNRMRAGLKVDGEFGPATERAVRNYQSAQGIPGGGGEVGYRTWNALHRGSYKV